LSHYLLNALQKGEKTLVCCIANVALDNIARALIETLELEPHFNTTYKKGQVLRIGNSRDPELVELEYLFPHSQQIDELRKSIRKKNRELSKAKTLDEKNVIRSLRNRLKKDLAGLIQAKIRESNIVFCTAAKFHVDASLNTLQYDNLVIDEASMMGVPHFIPMASRVNQRLIITGDFRQLGPVVLSRSSLADKWLQKDLFQFCGLDYSKSLAHPSLTQLDMQRRFHPAICGLINRPFYLGKLKTDTNPKQSLLRPFAPNKNKSIAYINLKDEEDFVCKRSSKGSRFNKGSCRVIVEQTLAQVKVHPKLNEIDTIGIITPYKAQVNKINQRIMDQGWPKNFLDKIKVGTIHSFQGAQADLLILDLVESKERNLGILYKHETGKRLMNVAVSRSRSKLIVVGDIDAILNSRGSISMSSEVASMLKRIQKH
jgi:superfamily I DNA and/or RNA helicase